MEKTTKAMTNIMAALHTIGVGYEPNMIGHSVKENINQLLKRGENPIEYIGHDGGREFIEEFEKFSNIPKYSHIYGNCWAETDDWIIIQLSRYYIMTDEDWEAYAKGCCCDNVEDACMLYGDPPTRYMYFNVKIRRGDLYSFLQHYAKYCW